MIDPGRERERCLGTSVVDSSTLGSVGAGTLKGSSSVSNNCLEPRLGGGDNDVTSGTSSSTARAERRAWGGGNGCRTGVCI